MNASRLLSSHYRSFLRLVWKFEREHIPLLRVSQLAIDTEFLDPRATVRATFRSQQAISPSISSAAFARLTQQFDILLHAEDRTKEAFGTWQNLLSRYGQVQLSPNTVSRAVEDAALVLPDLALGEAAWSVFDIEEEEETEKVSSSAETCGKIDELANGVSQQAPAGLFTATGKVSEAAAESGGQLQQLAHLHKVLVEELKYIEKPFEWAYEGLGPLLVRDVLETRRGISFSLTILFSCIARRLGVSLTPVPVSQIDVGSGHSIATPELSKWLLRHDGMAVLGEGGQTLQQTGMGSRAPLSSAWYWDPVKGTICDRSEVLLEFPHLGDHTGKGAILRIWTEMLRVAIVAHQRRGDSDAIAHCLHQLLALDLTDPGWDAMLKLQPVRT
ncbi:hypothetical protein COCOBI_17-1830 [Coccomyxa sp. Obi]|nr:hypothetical protein COCOBI_17-1830 [Coccomyxa sp. Obi]